jgi:hypothetical protein
MAPDNDVLDPEVLDAEEQGLARQLRSPGVPVSVNELAARKGEAVEILDARAQVLNTARTHAIRVTHPEDWVLFRSKDERVVGYLEDSGCERVRPIFGISIFGVEEPKKIVSSDGRSFAIIVRGRGRSGLTLDEIEAVEGIRESTDDFCKDLQGIKQEVRVRQAARANLDGKIVRELAGLASVPIEELTRAWTGTDKKVEHCRKGRGFGSQDERFGGTRAGAPDVEPPVCAVCGTKGALRKGKDGKPDWYGCPNYEQHPGKKWSIDLDKWLAKVEAAKQSATPQQPQASSAPAAAAPQPTGRPPRPEPMPAGDIFGRDPGQEG